MKKKKKGSGGIFSFFQIKIFGPLIDDFIRFSDWIYFFFIYYKYLFHLKFRPYFIFKSQKDTSFVFYLNGETFIYKRGREGKIKKTQGVFPRIIVSFQNSFSPHQSKNRNKLSNDCKFLPLMYDYHQHSFYSNDLVCWFFFNQERFGVFFLNFRV